MNGAITWQGVLAGALLFMFLVSARAAWKRWGALVWRSPPRCRKCRKRVGKGGGTVCWDCSAGGRNINGLLAPEEVTREEREARKEAFRQEMRARNAKAR